MAVLSHSADSVQSRPNPVRTWFWEARTRILLWYALLLLGLVGLALPLMRYRLFAQVDARVLEDLDEEVEAFRDFRAGRLQPLDQINIQRLQQEGNREKFTLKPSNAEEFKTFIDIFLMRRVPEDDTFLIAKINGQFYRSSPAGLPADLRPGEPLFEELRQIQEPLEGVLSIQNRELGDVIYRIKPVRFGDRLLGQLIIVHATEGERREVLESLREAILVISSLAFISLGLGWWFAGRVLSPLRLLSTAVRQISESDLSRRISVQGRGELANLGNTFNDMMERLEAAFQTQRDLLNDAGHELRTPITIIRGHLELMEAGNSQDVSETRDLVIDELDRMSRLVDELILLAKSERPDFLQLQSLSTNQLIEELFVKVQAMAERKWQLDEVATVSFLGDRQRLTEAMLNLVQNAVHHTVVADRISLGCRQKGQNLHLWVCDTGEGIAPEDQERIFERFTRTAHCSRAEGSGLGLAIVRAIAESHGGYTDLVSEIDQGAKFTLVLPLQGPHPSEASR